MTLCAAVACALCGLCPARLSLRIQPYRIEHMVIGEGSERGVESHNRLRATVPSEAGLDETLAWCACGAAAGGANTRDECRSFARDALESRVGSPGARAMPSGSADSMCTNHHGRRRGRQGVASPSRRGNSLATRIRRGTLSGLTSQSGLGYFVPHMSPPPRPRACNSDHPSSRACDVDDS